MKKVIINGKEYSVKYSLKCLFKYEQLFGHPYTGETSEENYQLLHATLFACNDDYSMTFDDLIDACDNDPGIYIDYMDVMSEAGKRLSQYFDKKKEEMNRQD